MRVHRNCCGLDVHKKIIAACLIKEDAEGNSIDEKRQFGSMTRDLHELARWLCAAQVTAVAMEATVFPVWNVLEPYGLQLLLINPEHYKAVLKNARTGAMVFTAARESPRLRTGRTSHLQRWHA